MNRKPRGLSPGPKTRCDQARSADRAGGRKCHLGCGRPAACRPISKYIAARRATQHSALFFSSMGFSICIPLSDFRIPLSDLAVRDELRPISFAKGSKNSFKLRLWIVSDVFSKLAKEFFDSNEKRRNTRRFTSGGRQNSWIPTAREVCEGMVG